MSGFGEGYDIQGGPTAQKGFLCPWANRAQVAQGLLGLSSTTHIGSLTLNTPLSYPELATMYAHSISIQGVGPPTQGAAQLQFTYAIVSVNYQCLPWSFAGTDLGSYYNNIDPNTPLIYCKQNMAVSTTWIGIPSAKLKFASGNPVNDVQSLPLCQIDMQLTFIRVPYLPGQAVLVAATAPLNSATFLGCAAGYVLFNGMTNEQGRDTAGNFIQDCTYSFSYRNVPWDQAWDPKGQAFSQVQNSSGSALLARSDLNATIPPGYLL